MCVCVWVVCGGGEKEVGKEDAHSRPEGNTSLTFWQALSKVDDCVQEFTTAAGVITLVHYRTRTHYQSLLHEVM